MSAFYKCVLNGSYLGKDNQSTLYYRTAIDPFGGGFGMGGAVELADLITDNIVPKWRQCKPPLYTLQSIDITPYNDTFSPAYQMPYKADINLGGLSQSFSPGTDGPAIAVNMRFNLEPVMFGAQRLFAPKRGYIAVGPIPSSLIDDSGKLTSTFLSQDFNAFTLLAEACSANLTSIVPPAVFFPVRISQKWDIIGGVNTLVKWGYADIQSATFDLYSTYRRSRRIRG